MATRPNLISQVIENTDNKEAIPKQSVLSTKTGGREPNRVGSRVEGEVGRCRELSQEK